MNNIVRGIILLLSIAAFGTGTWFYTDGSTVYPTFYGIIGVVLLAIGLIPGLRGEDE